MPLIILSDIEYGYVLSCKDICVLDNSLTTAVNDTVDEQRHLTMLRNRCCCCVVVVLRPR